MADQFDIDDLVRQLRDLVSTLGGMGKTGIAGGAATGSNRDMDRLLRAIATMATSMDKGAKSSAKAIDEFVKNIDKAIDAQEETVRAQQRAQAEVDQAGKVAARQAYEAAEESRRRSMSAAELAREAADAEREARAEHVARLQSGYKKQYADLQDKLYRETNYAKRLAGLKDQEAKSTQGFSGAIDKLARRYGEGGGDMVAFYQAINKAAAVLGALSPLGKGVMDTTMALAQGKTSFDALTPIIDGIGKALSGIPWVGPALQAAAEGAKYLLNQLQQATETFQKFGAAGALTTEGMSGVQRQFLQSGMSLDGFRKAVTENATTLARFGGTAGRGAEAFSQIVGQILDSDVGDQLRRLGYSADAFGESTAAYLNQQTRLGLAQTKTNAQLAQGAAAYARELDTLSKLTGMQREEIQKQQDAAKSESRFRAQLDEMTAQGKEKEAKALLDFQTMISKASPEMAQGLRDLATGNATTEAAQQVLRMGGQRILEDVKAGIIGPVDAFKQMQKATQDNLPMMRGLAKAVGDETKAFTNYAQASDLANARIVDGQVIVAEQNKQMTKGNDKLTDTTVGAQKSMEQMSRQLQGLAFKILPTFSSVVDKTTSVMRDALKKMGVEVPTASGAGGSGGDGGGGGDAGAAPTPGRYNPRRQGATGDGSGGAYGRGGTGSMGGSLTATAGGALAGAAVGSAVPIVGTAIGGIIGGALGYMGYQAAGGKDTKGTMSEDDLRARGLVLKKGDVQAKDGALNPRLVDLAQKIQSDIPGFAYFSGFNDRFHQEKSPSSAHTQGLAADFTLSSRPSPEQGQAIVNQLKSMGFATAIDEYNSPSAKATAGHFHAAIQAATGGVFSGPRSGYNAMLHGTEAVVPLPDGKTIPVEMPNLDRNMEQQVGMMGAQLIALEELVRYMRDNNAINTKILQAANN